ncbi:MAG: ATP-dependent RNA helicase DbpA [Campylobacterota bacterium]|nr:ATP-dependent RNA helicase DbpA [Campylobacterota bacterium]
MTKNKFETLNLDDALLKNLKSLNYNEMTPIQEKALPYILKGDDLIAKAKTGSGKTITFGLGLLHNLNIKKFNIQSLVLAPTRELAVQIANSLREIVRCRDNVKILTLTGGSPYHPQVHSLSHNAHIIVGTPGRILKHLQEENFKTLDINTLVLDEADRMLDMGFSEDINSIIDFLPKQRQTLLFSATYPDTIDDLSSNIMSNPTNIEVESTHNKNIINQEFYDIQEQNKTAFLPKLFKESYKSVIIFCNTKIKCDEVADALEELDMEPLVLHSDLEQKYRDETLILFANKSYPILIATDVASRGLDIDDVDLVINYDIPNDFEVYTHRIGRTARAGKNGLAISLIENIFKFEELKEYLDIEFNLINSDDIFKLDDTYLNYDYSSIYIGGGKRHKLRAGDILGALTAGIGLEKDDIGKINILPTCSYVAVKNAVLEKAFSGLSNNRVKNRFFKVYKR